jgi:hypothetical protein
MAADMTVYRSQAVIQKNSVGKLIRVPFVITNHQQIITDLHEHRQHEQEQSELFDHHSAFKKRLMEYQQTFRMLTVIPKSSMS